MPDKYYIDGKGNIRVVPEGKEQKFITKYPGSREATNKELSDFENKRAEMQSSTQRESNIQNGQGSSTAKNPTNQPLNGQNTSFVPNQYDFNIPNYAEEFAKNKPELSLRQPDNTPTKIFSGNSPFARPSKDGVIADAMKKAQDNRRQDTDFIIQSAIDEYESYKKWIDEVNRDPEMSESVKKGLNDWYNHNFRDTNNATDDVRIPSLVKDYLENNKSTVPTSVWVQGSSMFGGGHYAEGTKQDNTPEQMAMIADFLVNSPKGRLIMEDEKLYLKRLDDNIDELEKDIRETSAKRREITPKTIRMRDYLRMPKWEKEKFNKEREAIRADIEKQYPFGDLMNSQNQLNELKKLREAYNDGDKGAIKQLLKEFGRRLPYDLANAGSLGTIGLTDQSALSSALENPKNVLTRKGYNLVNEYQQAHELDRSIAQDIARGTTQTLPFITQFVATGGVTSAAGKGLLTGASKIGLNAEKLATIGSGIDKTTRLGKGLSTAGNVSRVVATDVLDAGARSLIMPNTYADAFARSIDNPGSYLDNLTHSWFVNTIENYSEKFGAHLPGIGFKNPKLKKIMDQTGIQGFPEEFAEEQLGTILNAAFNTGEAEWSDLVDPRNQLITAGTIGLLQIPYASVSAGGYAAGKYRDIKQKRSIRKGYNSNLANMNNVFGEESEALISTINQIIESDNSEGVGINSFIANVASDAELTDKEKDAVFKYTMSYVPYSALNQSKQEQVQEVEQQVTQAVEENANPEMGAVVSATIAGVEGPMQIVSGNIVQREDGSIDREASDKQIFYTDAEGNKQVTSIDFVENVEENIPTQDAIAQLTEVETANVISQQENEEVREYTPGEIVTADIYGNGVPFTGQITEVTEAGNYIIVGTQSGQRAEIQPRQIINQDNIQVVDNGSLVQYRNEKGEIVQGTVNDAYGLRPQGMMDIDGNVVPISDVIGLVEEEEQLPPPPANMMIGENGAVPYNPNVSNSQYSTQVTQQNEQSVTTSPSGQNNLSYIEQIPQNESGSLLFEQVPVETTIGALNEVYSDAAELSGVVDATISNIGKQIDKAKSPKPTGDITKDIANKQKANQQIEELNNRLSYWEGVRNAIQQNRPIEQRITEQLTGEETPTIPLNNERKPRPVNRNTPFQRRLNAVEENMHSVRDRILFGIASGAYKFRWNDKGVSMGLAKELGLSGSEAERKARIGLLSNNGYTPSTLAHRIWEETGGELNDNDIRSEVIDVLNSVSSRKQALETLENNAGITEEQYQQQQTEASEYELQLRAEVEARYNEILSQQIEEDLVSLKDEAVSLGATLEQIEDVRTPSDFIDLIEQLQDGQQEQTSDRPGSNEQTENVEGEGNNDQRTQRAVSERNRSEESTGDSRQDSDSAGDGINLSPEEQRVVNEATAQIDAEIAEAQKELTTQQKELSSARKRLGKAQADTQGNLFGSEQQSKLFNVPADLSKENAVDNILSPIQQQIDAAQTNLDTLTNSRDARIQEALDNYRKQGNLLDEIARAEAETDTSPTEAQKEAGNYKKGKVTIQGFNISIEQPQGSVRSGVDANDKEWSITMNNTYGYIRGTEGKDRDHIDVFLGNNPESNRVFVVDQINQDGSFDEHKVMLGFDSIEEAREAYLSNYEEGWQGLGNITEVDVDTFRKWTDSETRRIKPFAEYKEIQQADSTTESSSDVRIVEYSDKSIAVYGNTKEIKDQLKAIGGRFNPKLKDGAGWIFPKSKESDVRTLIEGQSSTPVTSEVEVSTPAYGASNTLISTEKYEELRKQMRGKLNNLNSGFDPELFTIGTQMAMYHIEAGARKFADFANRMIEDLGDNVRPYLKSFYEGARQMPSMETMRNDMDSFNTVNSFDLDNLSTFEDSNTPNINSNETNSDNRSDNSIAENGGISTRATDADVRERTASTQTDGRTQSEQRPAMETEGVEQRDRSDRDRGNNAEPSGTELRTRGTERSADNRRKDTGDTEQSGKPLNTNNNKQSREENVVPRGNTAKINANIAAIKLAKRLIETRKKATSEQMNVLRRYTGWGGLSSVFQQNDKNYKAQRDIDAYEPQIGQPFAKESELKATEEKVEDLNAQMEVELKQIEEAESKEDVEAIDIDGIVEKNTDDNPEDDPTPPSGGRRQTSSSGNFQSIPAEKFDRLVDKLTQTGLAVDVIIEDNINKSSPVLDNEGNVYGYVTPEGVVHLDATRMNANTPIHEFGHLWNSFTKENDTALYNRGIELIKKSPYWVQVAINSDYSYLPEEQAADEAIAMAIGDKGELITNRKLKQQFVDWLSEIWQSIKRAFGINTNVSLADMTLSDFTDRAVQDLLRGERLTDTSVQSKETRMQSVNDLADATNSIMTEEVRNQLDSRIKNFRFRIREAWEDRHLAVKEFIDTLRKNGVEIAEYNDYYKQATHINGKIDAQLEHYNEKFQKPLNKAISDLEKAGFDYRAIENYAILKHGLERNEWMRQDAINQYKTNNPEATQEQIDKYTESLPDDYSGITAVQEEVGMSAEEFITEFENKAGKKLTDNFWKKVKDTTQYSISKQLEGGLIDKKTFDDLTSRYDYYIPLRGHDAEVAEDRWDYSPNMGTYFVAPLIKAKGRKTRSESPFAYIFSMAQSSINSANRNWLNQTMLRLARKDTTGLMGVSQSWYVMDGMNADGVPTYKVESPTFSENAEQYRKNIEEFEERMQKLAEQGFAYPSGSKLDIGGMFIKRNQADQHEVHVWQNGKEFTVYINANPAVARAINGVNAKDLHKDLRFIAKVSRQMAANFTTRNPIFVATNFSRDYIFASSILPVKEDAKYAVQFQRNIPRSAGALQRYIRGKADLTKQQDQYVIEYIMNGAKTGFSHIVELDKIQKRIEREIKNGESKNVFRSFLDVLEGCNEFAENLSRLSVYITSREQGRSITQSISDAKEVTVNFNRSGAGGYGAAWFRSLYLFVNAGIQALSNFAKVAQKNKGKTALLISGYAMTGFLMPMLTALVGGDDGLDEYMKLSDWERQNNLCLYTGSGFIKIPLLPHELRVFHAMGDNIYQAAFGRKDTTETLLDVTMSFSDLIPANPMGAIQGSWADIMPDATKPFFQLQANRNFTGSRIVNELADPNKPGYLRVRTNKKGELYAPAFLVKLGQSLDAATGGDGVEKGLISFNPDEVNHILRGYFGGLYTIGTQVVTIGDKVYELADTGEFKLKVRETPLKTFYTSESDLMTTSSGLNSKYFKISDDMQETQRKIKGYQEQALNGDLTTEEFAAKISKFAPDIEKYKRLYPYMKQIKKYESALKDLDGEDQKEAERIIADMKKQVIEINSIK